MPRTTNKSVSKSRWAIIHVKFEMDFEEEDYDNLVEGLRQVCRKWSRVTGSGSNWGFLARLALEELGEVPPDGEK